ncbi:MAG: response regulator, partial [Myxococcales bacterium]|nr:response regulator [Myxococcales bacterium]
MMETAKAALVRQPTVLFVDDDADLTRSIALALRRAPFRTLTTNAPEAALALLASEHVDVVVSDDQMPGMSGAELLTVVRSRYPSLMRILLTGQQDIRRAMNAVNDASVFRFLLKPCDTQSLVATVEAALAAKAELAPEPGHDGKLLDDWIGQL